MLVAEIGTAGQEDARKHCDVPAECVLVQEANLCGEFDVAHARLSACAIHLLEADGNRDCQLKVVATTVIEIQTVIALIAIRDGSLRPKEQDFVLAMRGGGGIVGQEWRSGSSGCHPHRNARCRCRRARQPCPIAHDGYRLCFVLEH